MVAMDSHSRVLLRLSPLRNGIATTPDSGDHYLTHDEPYGLSHWIHWQILPRPLLELAGRDDGHMSSLNLQVIENQLVDGFKSNCCGVM